MIKYYNLGAAEISPKYIMPEGGAIIKILAKGLFDSLNKKGVLHSLYDER